MLNSTDLEFILYELYNSHLNYGSPIKIVKNISVVDDIYNESTETTYTEGYKTKSIVNMRPKTEELSEIGRNKKAIICFSISRLQILELANFLYPELDMSFNLDVEKPINFNKSHSLTINNMEILSLNDVILYNNLAYDIVNIVDNSNFCGVTSFYTIECVSEVI